MTKSFSLSPEALKVLLRHPLPNFHKLWEEYAQSSFRRELLQEWAGDDPVKLAIVTEMLEGTAKK